MREIHEELRCEVTVGDEVVTTSHEYDFGIVHLATFYCDLVSGTPQLVEHAELVWSDPSDLRASSGRRQTSQRLSSLSSVSAIRNRR